MTNAARLWHAWRIEGALAEARPSRRLVRTGVSLLGIVAFVYCAWVGWQVLGVLRQVRLSDLRVIADVVSVGDLLLCLFGYVIGTELLRAALRRR